MQNLKTQETSMVDKSSYISLSKHKVNAPLSHDQLDIEIDFGGPQKKQLSFLQNSKKLTNEELMQRRINARKDAAFNQNTVLQQLKRRKLN